MRWHIQVMFDGALTGEEAEQFAASAQIVHTDSAARTVDVTSSADGEYADAADAVAEINALGHNFDLVGPARVLIETEEQHARMLSVISNRQIAAKLGVSDRWVRELRKRPDWPTPVMALADGDGLYTVDSIEAFKRGWDRKTGRPAKAR